MLVYAIPTEGIKKNIYNSVGQYNDSGTNPEWSEGYDYTLLDDYTDATFILSSAVYPDSNEKTSPFLCAALVPHYDYVGVNNDIVYELNGFEGEKFLFNYARYWHGYLVFLKPLLFFMSLNSLRILNFIFEFIVISLIFQIAALKTKGHSLSLALMLSFLLLNPISTGMNFQLAAVMNVTLLATLIVLWLYEKMDINTVAPLFFLVVGISVVYVDFLTYPIISLIIPLLTFMYLKQREICPKAIEGVKYSFIYLIFWGFGYIGMWLLKWVIATIVSVGEENILKEAYEQIVYRSGNGDVKYSFVDTVIQNAKVYAIWPFAILIFSLIVAFIVIALKSRKKPVIRWNIVLPLLFVGIFPFLWYFGAREHSMDHFSFTFRNLAGVAMAITLVAENIVLGD